VHSLDPTKSFPFTIESKNNNMKFSQAVFLFAMLGVASARVGESGGESVNKSDEGNSRNLQENFIEIAFTSPAKKIVTPGRGNGLALGGGNDNIRVMIGFKNNRGKLKAMASEASESINAFKSVNALTMVIPRARLNVLANDPDIE
jgi:hypothetical protein